MKKKIKFMKIFLLLLSASTLFLVSCRQKVEPYIVAINDKNLYLSDFLYEIYLVEKDGNQMEDYYQKNLGYSYWDFDYEGTSMRQVAKSSVLASTVMYEILAEEASKKGITLSSKELSDNETSIDSIISSSSQEELSSVGLTREVLSASYNKKSLVDKYRKELEQKFTIDESKIRDTVNPEDYREYKTECLFIPTVKTGSKTLTPLSDEEIATALSTISDAFKQLSKGTGFDSLVNKYDNLAYYTRNFVYGEGFCEEEYQDASVKLENSEYSPVITTPYGYYIIHMLNNNSPEKYERAVEDAIEAEKEKQFKEVYNKIKDQYDITINFDYWDTITVGSITVPKD